MTIGLENIGSEPIALVFIFSAPGFEDYMHCVSVPAGQERTTITREELRRCAHAGHTPPRAPWLNEQHDRSVKTGATGSVSIIYFKSMIQMLPVVSAYS